MIQRIAKPVPSEVLTWVDSWKHLCQSRYLQLSPKDYDTTIKIASVICLAPEKYRKKVYWALSILFIGEKRKSFWGDAVDALPTDSDQLLNLTRCVIYYEKLAAKGHYQPFAKARVNPVSIIETMCVIGDGWKGYLDMYKEEFYTYPAAVFSEKRVEEAGKQLRGRFGAFSKTHGTFTKEIDTTVEVYEG